MDCIEKRKMEWKYFLNRQVFVQLKKGDCYTGAVLAVEDGFIIVLDKFGERVALALSEISKIKEENRKNGNGGTNGKF